MQRTLPLSVVRKVVQPVGKLVKEMRQHQIDMLQSYSVSPHLGILAAGRVGINQHDSVELAGVQTRRDARHALYK